MDTILTINYVAKKYKSFILVLLDIAILFSYNSVDIRTVDQLTI